MKRAHLLTGGLVVLSGAVLVGGAVWFLAGRGSEEAATQDPSSATATVTTSPTATADASLSPTASPAAIPAISGPAVVFFRAPTLSYPAPFSELWISGLDGSGSRRLSPEGVKSTFAGTVSTDDRSLVYYVAFGADQNRSLREADLSSGADREVLSFSGRDDFGGWASVSPDGNYVSFTNYDSIWLFNMETQQRTALLQGNAPACENANAGKCFAYGTSQWSPGGRLLLLQKGFYEGAHFVLADPFSEQPQIAEFDQMSGTSFSSWSPDGQAVCMGGQYGGPTSLYLTKAPDWAVQQVFPEFEAVGQTGPAQSVAGCYWPSSSRVVTLTWPMYAPSDSPSPPPELVWLSADTSEAPVVKSFLEGQGLNPALVGVPGSAQGVVQFWNGYDGEVRGSFLVDLETGQVSQLLGPGQWVVAIVSP